MNRISFELHDSILGKGVVSNEKHITIDAALNNAKRLYSLPPTWLDARAILFLGTKLPEPNPKYDQLLQVVERSSLLQRLVKRNLMEEFQRMLSVSEELL